MTAKPISVLDRVAKSTPPDFWKNHLAAFKSNGIPAEIDTQALRYSTNKCAPWVKDSYSDVAKVHTSTSITAPMIVNTSAQVQDVNSTESGLQGGSNYTGDHPLNQQGAIYGLSNLKRKMEENDCERAAFKIKQ
jgi:hypothetical protein